MNESEPLAEYTVRDFSAVEAQIQQIADREKIVTQKLKIANYKQIGLLAAGALVALGMFLVLAGIAYRIAFPPEKKEIIPENTLNFRLYLISKNCAIVKARVSRYLYATNPERAIIMPTGISNIPHHIPPMPLR